MTDYEHFIRMFTERKEEYNCGKLFSTPYISFKIGAGLGGSNTTCGMITFTEEGKFLGIMHAD